MIEKKNEKALMCAQTVLPLHTSKDKLRLFRLVVIDLDFLVQS